ncbi:MAG: DUF3821 domain-containing protein [Methanoregula sp.]
MGVLLSMIIIPLPAASYMVAPDIDRGATIYIGEEGLNLTHALNRAGGLDGDAVDSTEPTNWSLGWWASAAEIATTSSSKSLNISTTYQNLTVAPAAFVGYTGYWYLEDPAQPRQAIVGPDGLPRVVLQVRDPSLDIRILDLDRDIDVTGRTIPRGDSLGIRIVTNMHTALNRNYRSPVYNLTDDGYIDIKVRNETGFTYTQLSDNLNTPHDLLRQNISSSPWIWGDPENPSSPYPWGTGAEEAGSGPVYPPGTYTVIAESLLNNMKENYRQGGADYTGKTVSQAYTITLVSDYLSTESNRDSVARGDHFSVTITGKPKTAYFFWVNDTGTMTGVPGDQPPTILVSAMVYQDPNEGPYDAIGAHEILGAGGKKINEDVPPSTGSVSRNEYYAKAVTSASGTATVEFRTSPDTKPGTYAIRAEDEERSDDVLIEVASDILPAPVLPVTKDRVIYHPLVNPDIPEPANNDLKRINREATLFIGEGELDLSGAIAEAAAAAVPAPAPEGTVVGWWALSWTVLDSSPSMTVDLAGRESRFFISPADFVGYTGTWYLVDPSTGMTAVNSSGLPIPVFSIADPSLDIKIWDVDTNTDVTGKSVEQGDRLKFRVDTNMYPVFRPQSRPDITESTPGTIDIKLKNENNARYTYLYQNNTTAISLSGLKVDNQPWFWGGGEANPAAGGYWGTDLLDRDHYYFYPVGTYTVCAESTLNRMKVNYKQGGADYTGKTVSQCYTITIINPVEHSTEITISPGTPNIINSTIASSRYADTIILNPGTYYEHDITVTKDITIRANLSAGGTAANTIIDGEYAGRIIDDSAGYSLTIDNLTFTNGKVTGDGGAIFILRYGTATITSSSFYNCSADKGGAIYASNEEMPCCSDPRATIVSSTFSNCSASHGNALFGAGTIHYSRIYLNTGTETVDGGDGSNVDATDNWWGSNNDPSSQVHNAAYSPWLVLNVIATPSSVSTSQTSTIEANFTYNSDERYNDPALGHLPDGIPVTYSTTTGSILPLTGMMKDGMNTTLFSPSGDGKVIVSATVDDQTVTTGEDITVPRIHNVSPSSGTSTGGTLVTITGLRFTSITGVSFGTTAAASYIVDSDTQISAVSPAHALGIVNITVTTVYGPSIQSASDQFMYTPPAPVFTINPGDSIQTAIDCSGPDYTMILNPGTYYEHDIMVTKNIKIRANTSAGGNEANTIIDAAYAGRIFNNNAHEAHAQSLVIDNLSLQNGHTGEYGGAIRTEAGVVNITSSSFSNCSAAMGGAIAVTNVMPCCSEPRVNIISSAFSNCSAGDGNVLYAYESTATIHYSSIYHGAGTVVYSDDASSIIVKSIDASNNWWGSNSDPSGQVSGNVTTSPWLVLNITATPSFITNAQTSTILINLTNNSDGTDTTGGGIFVPDGIPVAFALTSGTGSFNPLDGNITNGANTTTFTPSGGGTSTVSATVDGQSITVSVGSPASVHPFPSSPQPPTDPDHDGLYEDLNGDGLITFSDIQLYFYKLDWMKANEPVPAFDFNGNGNLEFDDIVHLNHEV